MTHRSTAGQAMVELAMFLPFLLMLVLGTIEITNHNRTNIQSLNLASTAARVVYDKCVGSSDEAGCANTVVTDIVNASDNNGMIRKTDMKLMVSIWRMSSGSPVQSVLKSAGSKSASSAYNASTPPDTTVLTNQKVLVIAETICDYRSLTPIGGLLGSTNFLKEIKNAVIY